MWCHLPQVQYPEIYQTGDIAVTTTEIEQPFLFSVVDMRKICFAIARYAMQKAVNCYACAAIHFAVEYSTNFLCLHMKKALGLTVERVETATQIVPGKIVPCLWCAATRQIIAQSTKTPWSSLIDHAGWWSCSVLALALWRSRIMNVFLDCREDIPATTLSAEGDAIQYTYVRA